MSTKHSKAAHGTIVPQVKQLIEAARTTWGIPVTRRLVATSTGLSTSTVGLLYQQEARLYDLHTLWKLCWFFNCEIGDLLHWVPPAGRKYQRYPDTPVQVGQITLPRRIPAHPPTIRIVIPPQLEGVRKAVLIRGTGLVENTVATLLDREHPPTRIAADTLAALLDFMSQHEGKALSIATMLVYDAQG